MADEPLKASWTGVPTADELRAALIATWDHIQAGLDGTIAGLDGYELVLDLQLGGIPLRGRIKLVAPAPGKPHP